MIRPERGLDREVAMTLAGRISQRIAAAAPQMNAFDVVGVVLAIAYVVTVIFVITQITAH